MVGEKSRLSFDFYTPVIGANFPRRGDWAECGGRHGVQEMRWRWRAK